MKKAKTQMRLPKVMAVTGLSKATIYRLMNDKKFPKQKQIGLRAVAWFEDEIRAWQDQLKVTI